MYGLDMRYNSFDKSIREKDYLNLSLLLHSGYNINQELFESHLCTALISNDMEMLDFLFDNGADIYALDMHKKLGILRAFKNIHINQIDYLIKKGLDVNAIVPGTSDSTMILQSAGETRNMVFEYMLEYCTNINYQDARGDTALHIAVRRGAIDNVNLLIAKGAVINTCTELKETPLLTAIQSGNHIIAKILLKAGAHVKVVTDFSGHSPLMLAAKKNLTDILDPLVEHGADINQHAKRKGYNVLMLAAKQRHLGFVLGLIRHGVKINEVNKEGNTALYQAIHQDDPKLVQVLLDAGANPYLKNKKGINCFEAAHRNNKKKTLDVLRMYTQGKYASN